MLSGCIKEDFQETFNNSTLGPEVSLPVGSVSYNINDEFTRTPLDTIGPEGTIYFENNPYPLYTTAFHKAETNDINLRITNDSRENIESVTFHVTIKNSFPTEVVTQILLLNAMGGIIDSIFKEKDTNGPLKIESGTTDANGIVQKESVRIIDISYDKEKIGELQNVAYYYIDSYIYTKKHDLSAVRFFKTSEIYINTGIRIKFKFRGDRL